VSKRDETTILSRVIFRWNGILRVNPVTFNSLFSSIVEMYFIYLFISVTQCRFLKVGREVGVCPLQVSFGLFSTRLKPLRIFIHAVDRPSTSQEPELCHASSQFRNTTTNSMSVQGIHHT
jgi:hypothetical protein